MEDAFSISTFELIGSKVSMQEELGSLLHQLGTFGKCANDPKKNSANSAKL